MKYEEGQKIKIKSGVYKCLDDPFMEIEVDIYRQAEVTVIADIPKEDMVIVNISRKKTPVRFSIPRDRIA